MRIFNKKKVDPIPLPRNPNMARTDAPPIPEARRWLEGVAFAPDRPLLNLSQAAPVAPPPQVLRDAMAEWVRTRPEMHVYGPVLGLPELREEVAAQWSHAYGGAIAPAQVAITSGCNEAFTAVLACLAGPGDEVILPTPWYFNHKMALDMGGQIAVPLPVGAGMIPDPGRAAALITPRTRAIVLVTPNNPTGAEYPAAVIAAFRDVARGRNIALIVDETYRDFHARPGAPHNLFADPDWEREVIHLYSFSKAYRLTGHRVGAIAAQEGLLREVEKYLDTVTICPAQLGQHAALWGLQNLSDWLAQERAEILLRRAAMEAGIGGLEGWELLGSGAYFAYVAHPFDMPSDVLARALVRQAGVLMLPGTMFRPRNDPSGAREFRVAFANADRNGLTELMARLAALDRSHLAGLRGLS